VTWSEPVVLANTPRNSPTLLLLIDNNNATRIEAEKEKLRSIDFTVPTQTASPTGKAASKK
jgi:hypothetical protein